MRRSMLKSKIHRATVTHANVDYEGSLTLDADLLDAADILPYEEVHVWNVTQGTRFRTYAMVGERGSGVVCVNGAAAHLAKPGDLVIVATFATMEDNEARRHRPRILLVDESNRLGATGEIAGPNRPSSKLPLMSPKREQGTATS
ncbi:MAG TPA: aspartate 1-decarboxylase [Gemmataceae bacterium]|nr:aspartate 1-decarboxylase [Gemmataceae bacterium]